MENNNSKDLGLAINQFLKVMYVDFGINTENIKNWYKLSWEEFRKELRKEKVKLNAQLQEEWEFFFHNHKRKVLSLM